MTDTFQQLFAIHRQSHGAASPLQSDGKAFRSSGASDKVNAALDGYGKQMLATDKLSGDDAPPGRQQASGQIALNDASEQAVAAALTTAQQADQSKVKNAGVDQSNYKVYAERQLAADQRLAGNLSKTTALAKQTLLPPSGDRPTPPDDDAQSSPTPPAENLGTRQGSLHELSQELMRIVPSIDPDLVAEMNDLSGAADEEQLF
tara:strand:- start:1966 stop:2577 length:612 start_codon:yes stop_codon:yes gene_type:complete